MASYICSALVAGFASQQVFRRVSTAVKVSAAAADQARYGHLVDAAEVRSVRCCHVTSLWGGYCGIGV